MISILHLPVISDILGHSFMIVLCLKGSVLFCPENLKELLLLACDVIVGPLYDILWTEVNIKFDSG